jgi:hypothetical protein
MSGERAPERRRERRRQNAAERDPLGPDERCQRVKRLGHTDQRLVTIDIAPRGRGRAEAASKPGLEMNPLGLEPALGAMRLGVEAADELPVVAGWA